MDVSRRQLNRHRGRWVESISIYSPGSRAPRPGEDSIVIGQSELALVDSPEPILVHSTPLSHGVDLAAVMTNADETVLKPVPTRVEDVFDAPDGPLREDVFWRVTSRGHGSRDLALARLRRRLVRMPREQVFRFQARLVDRCRALVDRVGASWADAGLAVLQGESMFSEYLEGTRSVTGIGDLEFADLTDVAEEVVGGRIDVAGCGTSRDGLGASAATPGAASRWLSWRAVTASDGLHEVFYLARRPLGTSVTDATNHARQAIGSREAILYSDLEVWVPDGIGRVPAPFLVAYQIVGRKAASVDAYLASYGLKAGSRLL